MSVSDIVKAYEAGLITEREAAEQAMVDRVTDLYARLAAHPRSPAPGMRHETARTLR